MPAPRDKLTPLAGLDIIDRELKQVYAEAGHPERWKLLRYDVAHQETAEGRKEALAFLGALQPGVDPRTRRSLPEGVEQ